MVDFNEELKYKTRNNKKILYENRSVPIDVINALYLLPGCAKKYYLKTRDIILTAAYYLKNIIVLQAFEDGNHRTAIYITKFFLDSNGYSTKKVSDECYLAFRTRLLMWREKDYHTLDSYGLKALKFKDNVSIEENYVFEFCLKFIKDEILR